MLSMGTVVSNSRLEKIGKKCPKCHEIVQFLCWKVAHLPLEATGEMELRVPGRMDSSVPVLDDISPLFLSGKLWFHLDI